jgi:hypothetical protein
MNGARARCKSKVQEQAVGLCHDFTDFWLKNGLVHGYFEVLAGI